MANVLFEEFEKKYQDLSNNEEVFQKFIEDHTSLVPRIFEQNHGIHLDTVFIKVPFGNDWKSDFMIIAKSSADWNVVHIEIEDPRKKIFKQDGDFTSDFNSAWNQIETWRAWLSNGINAQSFKEQIKDVLLKSMADNPINHKYVLVYGRKEELEQDVKGLWSIRKKIHPDMYVMTYDSLFDGKHSELNVGKFADHKVCIMKVNVDVEPDCFLSHFNPCRFKYPKDAIEKMKKYAEDAKQRDALKKMPMPNPHYWDNTLTAISKIEEF